MKLKDILEALIAQGARLEPSGPTGEPPAAYADPRFRDVAAGIAGTAAPFASGPLGVGLGGTALAALLADPTSYKEPQDPQRFAVVPREKKFMRRTQTAGKYHAAIPPYAQLDDRLPQKFNEPLELKDLKDIVKQYDKSGGREGLLKELLAQVKQIPGLTKNTRTVDFFPQKGPGGVQGQAGPDFAEIYLRGEHRGQTPAEILRSLAHESLHNMQYAKRPGLLRYYEKDPRKQVYATEGIPSSLKKGTRQAIAQSERPRPKEAGQKREKYDDYLYYQIPAEQQAFNAERIAVRELLKYLQQSNAASGAAR